MADTPSESTTRPSLLVRLRDPADAGSWQTFVTTYAPLVYGYCRKRGAQDADAAAVAQEVLLRVARALRHFQYQPARGRFRDWLGTVTRHALLRFQQGQARKAAGGDALDQVIDPEPDAEWTAEFHAQVLRVALDRVRGQVEPATWNVFVRVWQDGVAAPQAARELGLPIGTVYAAKARVLKRLREEILMLAEDLPQCVPL
jgi:RNA polymerase sigma-70 factor (ECF subfamily)